ncbi:MAG: methyltransferase [Clostridia bacterium]|nr:methyltransferase [Clostridia bacterium]
MNYHSTYPEPWIFLKRFFDSPGIVGSVTPSSRFLAEKMVRKCEVETCCSIIELGAGTGVFTEYIERYKTSECQVHIFEKDPAFTNCLISKYPRLSLYSEAAQMGELISGGRIEKPELIISGLPFAVFESSLRKRILDQAYDALTHGGKFITFQYSLDLLKDLKKRYKTVELDFVLLNIPPAVVYRCTKD